MCGSSGALSQCKLDILAAWVLPALMVRPAGQSSSRRQFLLLSCLPVWFSLNGVFSFLVYWAVCNSYFSGQSYGQ